jgi:hypothetical protein
LECTGGAWAGRGLRLGEARLGFIRLVGFRLLVTAGAFGQEKRRCRLGLRLYSSYISIISNSKGALPHAGTNYFMNGSNELAGKWLLGGLTRFGFLRKRVFLAAKDVVFQDSVEDEIKALRGAESAALPRYCMRPSFSSPYWRNSSAEKSRFLIGLSARFGMTALKWRWR